MKNNIISKVIRHPFYAMKVAGGFIAYSYARALNKPYFGVFMEASQCHPLRQGAMNRLAKLKGRQASERSDDFNILEIGAWAGVSTGIWGRAARLWNGVVDVIDTWKATDSAPFAMRIATKGDRIFELFKHNIRAAGLSDYIIVKRGTSDDILPQIMASGKKYDLIYVDGDHAYSQVKKDLINCLPLLKKGGVICGDDLELQYEDSDVVFTQAHREDDYVNDPQTGLGYHAGVTTAVGEVLGRVECQNGFWYHEV